MSQYLALTNVIPVTLNFRLDPSAQKSAVITVRVIDIVGNQLNIMVSLDIWPDCSTV